MLSLHTHPFRIYYGSADDPLNNFYVPALSASVQYDRSAGYFSSSALAVAAARCNSSDSKHRCRELVFIKTQRGNHAE